MPKMKKKARVRRKLASASAASKGAGLKERWYETPKAKGRKGKDWVDKELDKRIKKFGKKRMTKMRKG